MKLKLLLVDDDVEMLQMMHGMLADSADRYEITGLAEDGAQALALVRETRPDVLITDITMPQMDGLTLIAEAKRLLPELKTVLITCHEDFQYAKEAIQLMVDEYLVKYTLTQSEFIACIEQLRERLSKQRVRRESFNLISGEVYKNKEQFKESYFTALVNGHTQRAAELLEKESVYDTVLPQGDCLWAALFVDDMPRALQTGILDEEKLLLFALMNIASDVFAPQTQSFVCLYKNLIFILLPCRSNDIATQRADLCNALSRTQTHAQRVLHLRPSALYLPDAHTVQQAGKALALLQRAREGYFYIGRGVVREAKAAVFAVPCRSDVWIERFRQSLFQSDKLYATLAEITDALTKQNCAPAYAKAVLDELNLVLDTAMRRYNVKLTKIQVSGDTMAECMRQMQDNIAQWVECMGRSGNLSLSQDIREVVQYVGDHLDSELSLEKVASVIYKNSSYLSRLFKRETGLTFSEYLTQKRVEKATWLLEQTAMNIEDVAQSIGMPNPQYFYRFFKREMGKRPGDVRRSAADT